MNRLLTLCLLLVDATLVASFHVKPLQKSHPDLALFGKKMEDEAAVLQQAYTVGTFVEFEEKKRVHIGTISDMEHKSNGGARYKVVDKEGKYYSIPNKAVHFAMIAPNSPGQAAKLFDAFCDAQEASEKELEAKLEISPEFLEMVWEESNMGDEDLTPDSLVELVHSHAASAIEKYMAWRLLQTESGHVFFKDIKDHGRIVSFKAKAKTAVDAAKQAFCNSHPENALCLV
jgi:hypothetical protein